MKKAERLNGIIFSLKENKRLTAKELAEIFEVSERTIYRDIDALSQIKVPIIAYDGLGGGYEIDDDYFFPSIKLNEQEAIMLLMILKLGDEVQFPNFKSDYAILKSKIYNTLTDIKHERIESLLEKVSFYLMDVIPAGYDKGVLSCIIEALLENKQLTFTYYTPAKDSFSHRRVSSKDLHFDAGGWYLTGYCHLREDKRVFRLDRISEICVLDVNNEHFEDVLFSKNDKFIPDVYTLKIEKELYRILKDNSYLKDREILDEEECVTIRFKTIYKNVVTRLVLENPDKITLLGPSKFKKNIEEKIIRLNMKYNTKP